MAIEEGPLSSVLDSLAHVGHQEAVSIGEVLDAFSHRSLGVLLTLFGLVAVLPFIGDIPGMAILTGSLVLLSVGQFYLGGGGLWMPGFVRRREISREKFERGIKKAKPWADRVDRLLKPRLTALIAGQKKRRVIAVAAAFLALTFYPLAFVPFGVNAPALGVLAFGLGLIARDGLLVLAGYVLLAVSGYLLFTAL